MADEEARKTERAAEHDAVERERMLLTRCRNGQCCAGHVAEGVVPPLPDGAAAVVTDTEVIHHHHTEIRLKLYIVCQPRTDIKAVLEAIKNRLPCHMNDITFVQGDRLYGDPLHRNRRRRDSSGFSGDEYSHDT